MYLGIDNGFILKDIFGSGDVFIGAEIDNINYRLLSGRMTMDILTKCDVVNPPKKWMAWDLICLSIELFAIKELKTKNYYEKLFIEVFSISKEGDNYILNIEEKDKCSILCDFGIARIHNITPMKYDAKLGKYEKATFTT